MKTFFTIVSALNVVVGFAVILCTPLNLQNIGVGFWFIFFGVVICPLLVKLLSRLP